MPIKIDITGFYYEKEIDPEGIVTVAQAMKRAAEAPAPNGGKLDVSSDLHGFVNRITVTYPSTATPVSRQKGAKSRPTGIYSYDDNPISGTNVVPGGGNINGQLVWQYYVRRGGVLLNTTREITPFTESQNDPAIGPLEPDDIITWRLVAIFGLEESMREKQDMLVDMIAEAGPDLSMKSAIRMLNAEG